VLNLQGELAQSIANIIQTKLTPEEHEGLAVSRPVNAEAYEAYLKGRYFWDKRTNAGLRKSIDYYQQAIAKDKYNALAYAGLAESYEFLRSDESLQAKEFEARAKETANKALELDNRLGEAHAVLARIMYFDLDWQGAEREFKRAIELSPGYATGHQRYSLLLMQMGRTEESLREIHLAQALDPLSLSISSSVGFRLLWARRYDQAINQLQKTLELDPGFAQTHLYFGWIYEAKGETEKAIQELRKATLAHAPHRVLASLGYVYALTGNTRQAQNILNQLQGHSTSAYPFAYDIAIVYAGLGKKDRAFEWLTKSCEERIWGISNLKVEPELDSLRSDPRFQDLLRRVGLPQ
jgi:tetratricopeptide (TPR) repeat protein